MESQVLNIMSSIFDISDTTKLKDLNAESSSKWDSLKHIQLILALEKECNIKIKPKDIIKLQSYEAILQYVSEKST